MLVNPLYLGQIRHKKEVYPGQHKPIVSQALWDKVQATLKENTYDRKNERVAARDEWWLTGKLFDAIGRPMTPTFTSRPNGVRYRYYFVQDAEGEADAPKVGITRIKMEMIHGLVTATISKHLASAGKNASASVTEIVQKVVIERNKVRIDASLPINQAMTLRGKSESLSQASNSVCIEVPVRIAKHGQRSEIIPPPEMGLTQTDPKIIKALQLAWQWRQEIENGTFATPELLAEARGFSRRYVNRMLPLGFLAPLGIASFLTPFASREVLR